MSAREIKLKISQNDILHMQCWSRRNRGRFSEFHIHYKLASSLVSHEYRVVTL